MRAWLRWSGDRHIDNQACLDFYFTVVRNEPTLRDVNVFEVLDTIVNVDRESVA